MKFNLTFNKPAVAEFIDAAVHAGMRVKVEGGQIMFKATKATRGADVFAFSERTRGGIGITISGKAADNFLKETGLGRGSHMKLAPAQYGWMVAEPVVGKPSKIVSTARLWREVDEMGSKAEVAPAKAPRKVRTPKEAPATASRGRKAKPVEVAPAKRGRKSNAQKAAEAQTAA
jgi:hypothetical protein